MLAGLTKADIEEVFKHLDSSGDGRVSINELLSEVQGTQLAHDARMKSFSPEFEAELRKEIEALFAVGDINGAGELDINEFINVICPGATTVISRIR